jgi:hypothetical protein
MTLRTPLVVSVLVLAAAACTGNSDAVDTPGVTSTEPEVQALDSGGDSTTVPTTTAAPTTVEATTPETTTTTAPTTTSTTAAPVDTAPAPVEPAPATTAGRNPDFLRQGDEGTRVGLIQFKLVVLGYLPTGSDTGVFDSATNSAVLKFQGDYGLIVDGVVGPETERAISAAAESINPEPG